MNEKTVKIKWKGRKVLVDVNQDPETELWEASTGGEWIGWFASSAEAVMEALKKLD